MGLLFPSARTLAYYTTVNFHDDVDNQITDAVLVVLLHFHPNKIIDEFPLAKYVDSSHNTMIIT